MNIHAPLKPVSKWKLKRLSKPWITKGLRTSIRIKNRLFYTNKNDSYRLYRNKITLIRISKQQYYHRDFYTNISNMKQTWIGINELINHGKKKMKSINALKGPINVYDKNTGQYLSLDRKNYVKFLGVFIDSNLKWSHHINYVALKISRIVGIIARLRHFVPTQTLLMIYRSLILPYLTYGICVWGHASKFFLNKLLILQKRVLCLIYFTPRNEHAIPLFIKSMILPVTMIYFETIANLMHDISHGSAPSPLQALFLKSNEVHRYNTRSATKGNFFQKDA